VLLVGRFGAHRSQVAHTTAKMRDLGVTRQLNAEQANFRMT
jgi:hypothetical protein